MKTAFVSSPDQASLVLESGALEPPPPRKNFPAAGGDPDRTHVPAEPFYWSSSRLRRLLQCPRQFRYAYLDRLRTLPRAPMVFGRILHEIICHAHEKQMQDGYMPPVDVLLAEFDGTWGKLIAENMDMDFPSAGPPREQYATLGREMLRVFHSEVGPMAAPLAVEFPFEIEVEILVSGEPRTVRLRGVIDRLDEITAENGEPALIIVDYKSSRRKLSIADADEEIQLTIYTLAAQCLLDLPVEQVELFSLRDGATLATERNQAHLDWLTEQILPYAERKLEQGTFPAAPGFRCRWCEFREQCDEEGPGPWIEPSAGGEEDGTSD